jgi:hypothetical protein
MDHLAKNSLLNQSQHGFMLGRYAALTYWSFWEIEK